MIKIGDVYRFPKDAYSDEHECFISSCVIVDTSKIDEENGYALAVLLVCGKATVSTHVQLDNFFADCLATIKLRPQFFTDTFKLIRRVTEHQKETLISKMDELSD